jgi:hypothetical protein
MEETSCGTSGSEHACKHELSSFINGNVNLSLVSPLIKHHTVKTHGGIAPLFLDFGSGWR